jgi:hypothetical protein
LCGSPPRASKRATSTTSSSRKKPPITASSRRAGGHVLLAAVLASASCGGGPREPLLTYFNGEYGLSLRYPASWKTDQAEQDGVWYRYFLGPPAGPGKKPAVSVTLLVGRLGSSLDEYAQTYLAGNTLASSRDEARGEAKGRSYLFASPDRSTRHSLLLLEEKGRVYGLYTQAEAPLFERHFPILEEMAKSLNLERLTTYPEQRNPAFSFSVRMPPSWRESRHFGGGGTLLLQYTSPALAMDQDRQTVHASLTLTVEPIPGAGTLEAFYEGTRQKLGSNFQVLSHEAWRGGYTDVMRTETPMAISRVKRFYRAQEGRGYSLTFEARDDVYSRVWRWYDIIASSLKIGAEMQSP